MSAPGPDLAELSRGRLPSHLYVHVPFCASKCAYCDFASVAGADEATVRVVFRAIRSQLLHWERSGLEGVLETVYFGGGTPTLVLDEVVETLDFVREHFVVHPGAELTLEANPESFGRGEARAAARAGVTRVSVGVQSFADTELRLLGRVHDAAKARRACEAAMGAGLGLSVDLICGVPGQSMASWTSSLDSAVGTGAQHVSVYPLTVEDDTALQVAVDAGLVEEVDQDRVAEQLVVAEEYLSREGFERYEVANYACGPSQRARHNVAYWTGNSYLGVGPGAHAMLDAATAIESRLVGEIAPGAARVRLAAAPDIEQWLIGRGESIEVLSPAEAAREDAMLGMRLSAGITDELARRAGVEVVLDGLRADGLVTHEGGRWATTRRGWLLGNEVFRRIWAGE